MFDNFISQYAPAGRSEKGILESQKTLLSQYCGSLHHLYDAVSEIVLIVNQERQIVFFNSAVPSLLGVDDPENIYGLRPGEALGCANACKNAGGCGTSEFCSQCGAVNAILASLSNKADLQECRLVTGKHAEALELLVRTTPLEVDGQWFVIMALVDISHEKRRRVLERIFFHDLMNTANTIHLFANLLKGDPGSGDVDDIHRSLLAGTKQLVDELHSQKILLDAENQELEVKMYPVDGCRILRSVVEVFRTRFQEHKITIASQDERMIFNTDQSLLKRILANMVQNALEASRPEQEVCVSCKAEDGRVAFHVHNESHIPRHFQLQLFQRSFSTKGSGRGLGTYSMKLLCEYYLNGELSLVSSPQQGTTFSVRFPAHAAA
jgi:signal transduction histidine kinase